MHCWSCGAELLEDSNFCHKCGVRVRGEHAAEPSSGTLPAETTQEREQAEGASAHVGPPTVSVAAEKEVWVGRPTIGSLAGRFTFAGVCVLGVIGGLAYLLRRFGEEWRTFWWVVASALLGVLGLWLLVSIVKTKLTLKYRLTTERLVIERGFLSKRTEEVDLLRVDEATVHQGLFDRLANVGNIVITSTEPSDPLYIVVGVEQPVELKEKIRQHARELRRRSLRREQG